jgi:hypothetical protein
VFYRESHWQNLPVPASAWLMAMAAFSRLLNTFCKNFLIIDWLGLIIPEHI